MFFRKNKKKEVPSHSLESENETLDKEKLIEEADKLVETVDSKMGDDRIKVLNKVGSLYFKAEKIDDAIKYYEISIDENKTLGNKAYTDLVKLYNIKRKEASIAKDGDKMKYYMEKTDSLLQLSKDVIRGRI